MARELKNKADDKSSELATKSLQKIVEYLVGRIVHLNGLPPWAGIPMKGLYSEYTVKMVELYRPASELERDWVKVAKLKKAAEEYKEDILKRVLEETALPKSPGILSLFGPLLDSRATSILDEERRNFESNLRKIVQVLDGFVTGTEELILITIGTVRELDKSLGLEPSGTTFHFIYAGGATSLRNNLCCAGSELFIAYEELINHRNNWAKIKGFSHRNRKYQMEFEALCPILR